MKKILLSLILILSISPFFVFGAADNDFEVNFFYTQTCPHCRAEKAFLDEIKDNYPEVKFNYLPMENSENSKTLFEFYKKYNVPIYEQGAVPATFIGKDYFIGFDNPEGIGRKIEESIRKQLRKEEVSIIQKTEEEKIKLPIIGERDVKKYSLPALAIILGFIDGFNVCSLAAIILILSLVLALKSRKKTLILGGIFILTTAITYGLLILFWHSLFTLAAPWMKFMQVVIGLLALAGGGYFLKQFLTLRKKGLVCEVSETKIYEKTASWLHEWFKKYENILLLALGVLFFAAVITVVEFPCSAVLPLIFAGILAKSQLPFVLLIFYLGVYLLFYLLDEILIFLIAVFSMKIWVSSPKIFAWINLATAIILILTGLYYLFF